MKLSLSLSFSVLNLRLACLRLMRSHCTGRFQDLLPVVVCTPALARCTICMHTCTVTIHVYYYRHYYTCTLYLIASCIRPHPPRACVTTQEPTRPVKFMDRPKNSQSDCRVTACRMIGNLNTIQNSACGHSAPAARDCMQNSRESQY